MAKNERFAAPSRGVLLSTISMTMACAPALAADHLRDGFANPPASARPWVWWHWMNGNISAEGALLDLEWMKRAGIGGAQLFEGNLGTPVVVDHRLVWMSTEWKAALRTSVATAKRLGLGMAIATSPGWSISGAPFVDPAKAMKRLVWSETHVIGGVRVSGKLAAPSSIAGPFQDVAGDNAARLAPFYRDIAVLAFADVTEPLPAPVDVTSSAGPLERHILADRAYGPSMILPWGKNEEAWVTYRYRSAVTIRSATVGLPGARGFGAAPPPDATLEGSDDGVSFRRIADLPATGSPVRSASFAPVTARFIRLRLVAGRANLPPIAPGVIPPQFGPAPARSFALSEFVLRSDGRVHRAEEKAGFAAAEDYYALATPGASSTKAIAPSQVINLSSRLRPDGGLDWTPPAGRWTVLRIGYALTGHQNGPAPIEATGLEVDKLDAAAVRSYADTYLSRYLSAIGRGSPVRSGITALLSDSIESGPQNWTPTMLEAFQRLRGYDARPWLPALTGFLIGSAEQSDRFLWDFRKTISDLLTTAHYGELASAAKARGLVYYAEALEDHRPQLGDDLAMRGVADVPMGAMWTILPGGAPRATFVADLLGAASVAHVLGRPIVAAESFTAFGAPWAFAPRDLKATADLEFALGVNRIVIHTSPHQPFRDRKPGMALAPFLGQYFSRTETWAEMARPWTDYLARSSFLLQQGRHAADIAYFIGEEAPVTSLFGEKFPGVLPGYGFDFIGPDALAKQLSVERDGTIVTAGGARYAVLMLGGSSRYITLASLRRLEALAQAGAKIVGESPLGSPSLADDDSAVDAVIQELWGPKGNRPPLVSASLEEALRSLHLTRAWQVEGIADTGVAVLHRRLDDGELWFVANRTGRAASFTISLRGDKRQPELWDADTGEIHPASYAIANGRTTVPLALEKDDAIFVVLRRPAVAPTRRNLGQRSQTLLRLDGPWQLSFADQKEAPAARILTNLRSWSEASDNALRFYSGVATYRTTFHADDRLIRRGRRIFLELGGVHEIAQVRLNDHPVGTAWRPPFRLDITDSIRGGTNNLKIDIANLWVNRLIGDARSGATKITFTTGDTYAAGAPLRASGLLGPVMLVGEDVGTKRLPDPAVPIRSDHGISQRR